MNEYSLKKTLSKLNIGDIRYFESIGSTNDVALAWATEGAPDLSLVIADEQTAGRGRLNRKWFTPKGSALAVSLILRPAGRAPLSRTVGLAALSLADAARKLGLAPRIKWPNDILLNGKKVSGILIESVWAGSEIDSLVIGMGINVLKASVPPAEYLQFPATSLEDEIGSAPDREKFLHNVLSAFMIRRAQMESDAFLKDWEDLLAFKDQTVQVKTGENEIVTGVLHALDHDGSLKLRDEHGNIKIVRYGDVSLRPAA